MIRPARLAAPVLVLVAALADPGGAQAIHGLGGVLRPSPAAAPARLDAAPARDLPTVVRPRSRDGASERRCAPDGVTCIAEATYAADLCRTIGAAAEEVGLDAGFFARLLWRESLFDAAAVSPAGAQGVAQFMPGTAELRGLADPFNPAEAVLASAAYLKELEGRFGNLGLAAVAYNAGEEGAAGFLAGARGLPGETRAYVLAITGHSGEAWRDALDGGPAVEPDLRLDGDTPFREACIARAEGRGIPAFRTPLSPWGVILAAQDRPATADRLARRAVERAGAALAGERIDRERARVLGQMRHTAQVGRETRAEAEALCERVRAAGVACLVQRN